jgi:hypothetical protein
MSGKAGTGSVSLSALDKLIWAFARSIRFSSFEESIYVARFWAPMPLAMACASLYRLFWKGYGILGEPALGGE